MDTARALAIVTITSAAVAVIFGAVRIARLQDQVQTQRRQLTRKTVSLRPSGSSSNWQPKEADERQDADTKVLIRALRTILLGATEGPLSHSPIDSPDDAVVAVPPTTYDHCLDQLDSIRHTSSVGKL